MPVTRRSLLLASLPLAVGAVALRDFALLNLLPRRTASEELRDAVAARPGAQGMEWLAVPAAFHMRLSNELGSASPAYHGKPVVLGGDVAMAGFGDWLRDGQNYLDEPIPPPELALWSRWWSTHPQGLPPPATVDELSATVARHWKAHALRMSWALLPGATLEAMARVPPTYRIQYWGCASGPGYGSMRVSKMVSPINGWLFLTEPWPGATMFLGPGNRAPAVLPL